MSKTIGYLDRGLSGRLSGLFASVNRLTGFRNAVQSDGPGQIARTPHQLSQMLSEPTDGLGAGVNAVSALAVAAVYACVRLLSNSQAMLPQRLYEITGDEHKLAAGHDVDRLIFSRPNRWQTPFEFEAMLCAHRLQYGNAYAYVSRLGKKVTELVPLNPAHMRVEQNDALGLVYKYKHGTSKAKTFTQAEIHHRRGLCTDGITGLSPIGAARRAIGLALETEKHGGQTFKNSARPAGVITHPTVLTPAAAQRIEESFNDNYAGTENTGKTLVLEEGMAWSQITMSNEDSQFIESRKFQRSEIAMFYGVPPHMIGDIERGTSWGSGLEQQNLGYLIYTLMPYLAADEQALARDLLTEEERARFIVKHDTALLTRADFLPRQNGLKIQLDSGVINADEWRKIEGLNPLPGNQGKEYKRASAPAQAPGREGQKPGEEPEARQAA